MPIIPYSDLDTTSRRLPSSNPAAGFVNPVLDGYCGLVQPVQDFVRDTLNRAIPGAGDVATTIPGAINRQVCPGLPDPADLPLVGPPLYPVTTNCPSRGAAAGSQYVKVNGVWTFTVSFNEQWECGDNRGWPIGPIRYFVGNGTAQYLGCQCVRPDGSVYVQIFTPEAALNPNIRLQVDVSQFLPCPGCNPIPTRPSFPVLPERPIPPLPPAVPQIPVNIELPQLPGFPPINFPAVYIPITPTLNLNAPITLAPNIDLNPNFQFAPRIELNLGGISIEGGGYPEPVPDVIEIINEGSGDCPDPCEPVDYDLIRSIAFQELDAKFPPNRPFTIETISYPAGDSSSIVLPEFAQWVTLTIVEPPRNVREQEGNALAPNVFYNGWYSFGVEADTGDRKPIQYNFVSVPVPDGARQFSYTIIGLGTASLTVGYLLEA